MKIFQKISPFIVFVKITSEIMKISTYFEDFPKFLLFHEILNSYENFEYFPKFWRFPEILKFSWNFDDFVIKFPHILKILQNFFLLFDEILNSYEDFVYFPNFWSFPEILKFPNTLTKIRKNFCIFKDFHKNWTS